jgi:hypothetical protein
LIWPKIKQFSQVQVLVFCGRVAMGLQLHGRSILRFVRSTTTWFSSRWNVSLENGDAEHPGDRFEQPSNGQREREAD